MSKIKIKLVTIGHMPPEFNQQGIQKWESSLFDIVEIESFTLNLESDIESWGYSDKSLEKVVPKKYSGDFLIAIINVPLEDNWYARRLTLNRVVFTFHEIKEILSEYNIPLENAIYRLLYAYVLLFKRSEGHLPTNGEEISFTHDETRGCLFDMNGIKNDIIYSCHKPKLCSDCLEKLKQKNISFEAISRCQKEIQLIRKPLFYIMSDFIKKHPVWSLIISGFTAVVLGALGSILGAYIYDYVIKEQIIK